MAFRDFPWTSQPQEWARSSRGTAFFDKLLLLNHGIYGDVLNNSTPIYSGDVALTQGVGGAGPRPRIDGSFPGFCACAIDPVPMSGDFTYLVYSSALQGAAPSVNTQNIEITPAGSATASGMRIGATAARAFLDNNLSAIVTGDFRSPSVFVGSRRGNQGFFHIDGHLAAPAWTTGTRGGFITGSSTGPRTGNNANGGAITYLQALWDRALSDQEIRALGNNPWQLFEPQRIWVPVLALVAPVELSGAAAAVASANGQLSTQILMGGAGAAVSAASGALTTAVRLGGAASAAAASAGALSTDIRLAGAAPTVASAAGALSTSIWLAGAAQAQATASGAIVLLAGLSGAASASASAGGALTTGIRLAGSASATASAAGALAAPGAGLAGSAKAGATATGALETGIRLGGNTSAAVAAAGQLLTSIRLAASATCEAMAAGALSSTGDALQGATVAQCIAAGRLTTQILLAARATGSAIATGRLAGDEAGRSYPLAGRTQVFPLVGQQQTYPLAGATQE